MSNITIVAVILIVAIGLFIWNRLPPALVAMATALALYSSGILTLRQTLAGFGDPAVFFIASLFIVSASLEHAGVTAWAGQRLTTSSSHGNRTRLLALAMLMTAGLTALVSTSGAVTAVLPVVVVMAVRLKWSPSKLMIPVVFAAHAGSMLALTGTPINVLISNASAELGGARFGFLEFSMVGVPLLVGTMAIVLLFGDRLLPENGGRALPSDFSRHARTLVEQYGLINGVFQMRVRSSSPLVGLPVGSIILPSASELQLLAVQDRATGAPTKLALIAAGDYLLVRGSAEAVAGFAADNVLALREHDSAGSTEDTLLNRQTGLAEVMIPPRSAFIGQVAFPGMITPTGDLIIVAIQRRGIDLQAGETMLEAGDTLLLKGTWKALDTRLADADVLVVNTPELVRQQAVALGTGARLAVGILAAMVVFLALGIGQPAVTAMTAAGALILTGVMTMDKAFKAINWTTIVMVASLISLSVAMRESGAATMMADMLVSTFGEAGPKALLAALCLLTALLTQVMSNTATALVMIPIGVAAASGVGISPQPVLMTIAIGAVAAFLSPIASATNLIIMGPGGYRFGDYWMLGLPVLLWFMFVAVFCVPLIWPF